MELDPKDPFERVLIEMAETSRKKSHDYAQDADRFSNFRATSKKFPGMTPLDACDFNIAQKEARLDNLRTRDTGPLNESVGDTYLDRAVYSVIAVALYREGQANG